MNLKEEIKKSATSEIVKTIIQSALLLGASLAVGSIPAVRDRIWPATPKWTLLVATGVFLSTSLVLLRLWLRTRRQVIAAQAVHQASLAAHLDLQNQLSARPPPKRTRFGVLWDENLEPFCPVHIEVPLCNYFPGPRNRGYICPGGHLVAMKDEDRHSLTPKEARERLAKELKKL